MTPIWIKTDWNGKIATATGAFNGRALSVDGSSQAHALSLFCGRIARRKGGKGQEFVTNSGVSGVIGERAFQTKSLETKSFDKHGASGFLL